MPASTHSNQEVEAFLSVNPVESHAAQRLRALPPDKQKSVIERGSLLGARDPSAVLVSRIRDAVLTAGSLMGMGMAAPAMLANAYGSGHAGVEALIARHNLDAKCAVVLRSLPPEKQALAAEMPVTGARNPSAFVMAQLSLPRFGAPSQSVGAPPAPPSSQAMTTFQML